MAGADAAEARRRYDRLAGSYDRQLAPLRMIQERLRRNAIAGLGLRSGDTVLDIGCGTGASFAELVAAVGPSGRVIGVDQSGGMLAQARRRIDAYGWANVELIESPVQDAPLPAGVDGALLFFTHDLLRTPAALDNLIRAVRPGGHVVTAGARRPPVWVLPLALPVLMLMRRYVTTSEGLDRPWDQLATRLDHVEVRLRALGVVYQAAGTNPAQA